MIFDVIVILVTILVGGLLLFPVKVRFLFCGKKNGSQLEVRLFRKKIFSTEEESPEENEENAEKSSEDEEKESRDDDFDAENPWKKEDDSVKKKAPSEKNATVKKEESVEKRATPPAAPKEKQNPPVKKQKKKKSKRAKKKSASSDREFLTILAEKKFSRKWIRELIRVGKAFFKIFQGKFEPTTVEGIRYEDDYLWMGYLTGSLNFLSGTIPLLENWEFHADWTGDRPFKIEGSFIATFSVARVLGFCLVCGKSIIEVVSLYFWNRHRYRKNPECIRLVFWRKWIVRFFSS